MKFGCLTWWRNNYGSILQAYALQEAMKEIDDVQYEIICQFGKKIVSKDNFFDKVKSIGIRKTLLKGFWKFCFTGMRTRSGALQRFVDEYLNISLKQYNDDTISKSCDYYDAFVCGSDQIWNPNLTSFDSMYWLTFAGNMPKFSYAPSIGIQKLSERESIVVKTNLESFVAVSCREESGSNLINGILGSRVCETVLDPTLMVDKKIWDKLQVEQKIKEKYIFTYMLRGTKVQRKYIEDFAKKKNMKIVTLPFLETEYIVKYDFKFGDIKLWDVDPIDFIDLIKNAEYTFTDSFHCIVFSLLYHTPFFIFPKKGNSQMTRIEDLQQKLNIDTRIIVDRESIELIENKKINWEAVDKSIDDLRRNSHQYLVNSVEQCKLKLKNSLDIGDI